MSNSGKKESKKKKKKKFTQILTNKETFDFNSKMVILLIEFWALGKQYNGKTEIKFCTRVVTTKEDIAVFQKNYQIKKTIKLSASPKTKLTIAEFVI